MLHQTELQTFEKKNKLSSNTIVQEGGAFKSTEIIIHESQQPLTVFSINSNLIDSKKELIDELKFYWSNEEKLDEEKRQQLKILLENFITLHGITLHHIDFRFIFSILYTIDHDSRIEIDEQMRLIQQHVIMLSRKDDTPLASLARGKYLRIQLHSKNSNITLLESELMSIYKLIQIIYNQSIGLYDEIVKILLRVGIYLNMAKYTSFSVKNRETSFMAEDEQQFKTLMTDFDEMEREVLYEIIRKTKTNKNSQDVSICLHLSDDTSVDSKNNMDIIDKLNSLNDIILEMLAIIDVQFEREEELKKVLIDQQEKVDEVLLKHKLILEGYVGVLDVHNIEYDIECFKECVKKIEKIAKDGNLNRVLNERWNDYKKYNIGELFLYDYHYTDSYVPIEINIPLLLSNLSVIRTMFNTMNTQIDKDGILAKLVKSNIGEIDCFNTEIYMNQQVFRILQKQRDYPVTRSCGHEQKILEILQQDSAGSIDTTVVVDDHDNIPTDLLTRPFKLFFHTFSDKEEGSIYCISLPTIPPNDTVLFHESRLKVGFLDGISEMSTQNFYGVQMFIDTDTNLESEVLGNLFREIIYRICLECIEGKHIDKGEYEDIELYLFDESSSELGAGAAGDEEEKSSGESKKAVYYFMRNKRTGEITMSELFFQSKFCEYVKGKKMFKSDERMGNWYDVEFNLHILTGKNPGFKQLKKNIYHSDISLFKREELEEFHGDKVFSSFFIAKCVDSLPVQLGLEKLDLKMSIENIKTTSLHWSNKSTTFISNANGILRFRKEAKRGILMSGTNLIEKKILKAFVDFKHTELKMLEYDPLEKLLQCSCNQSKLKLLHNKRKKLMKELKVERNDIECLKSLAYNPEYRLEMKSFTSIPFDENKTIRQIVDDDLIDEERWRNIFHMMDTNNDGYISIKEFILFMGATDKDKNEVVQKEIYNLFGLYIRNKEEVKLQLHVEQHGLPILFDVMNTNDDKKIDIYEWIDYVRSVMNKKK